MYIKVFDGVAAIFCEEQDRPCTHPDGHELNPDRGALNGEYGSYCIHCSHYVGRVEYFSAANGAAEAQAYARVMLGATGPVEVREIEWKWGPGDVPKSPIMSARPGPKRETMTKYKVYWDNGAEACGTFPYTFDTEEEAMEFGENWVLEMTQLTPDMDPDDEEGYSFDVIEIEETDPEGEEVE